MSPPGTTHPSPLSTVRAAEHGRYCLFLDAIMVNSAKARAYVPDMWGAVARIGTIEDCVAAVIS